MVRTRVGYAGGTKINPTYNDLGNHSETIQIDYDPTIITYQKLLDVFWDSHKPIFPRQARQYMSIIFYHNEEQKRLAMETKSREEVRLATDKLYTEIIPASDFYLAEAYHQKHYLQFAADLMAEFRAIYPEDEDFIASTAVARVNGYTAGNGTLATLQAELDSFGLSPTANKKLLDIVAAREKKD